MINLISHILVSLADRLSDDSIEELLLNPTILVNAASDNKLSFMVRNPFIQTAREMRLYDN